ncbi:hypothetical protein Q9251_02545 [Alkalihalobacillus macyae]|uniref:YpoC family protein n=1 Tax=Guptibacillus hwajinpoensis TaxID=208199 RepID=UPI00273AFA92|nr:hypothetical protein [Alkalihalobacillus macyae]MDP4549760.1 hypothetical protein [Alkalihalobacillus macyae]
MDDKRILFNDLQNSFFFKGSDWVDILKRREGRLPFLFEVMHVQGDYTERPWDHPEAYLNAYFMEWKICKPQLAKLFAERNKCYATTEMTAQIGYFFEALFWMNGLPASPGIWDEIFNTLSIKPLNGKERLQYLLNQPGLFVSFIQLDELIEEMHKKWKVKSVERL